MGALAAIVAISLAWTLVPGRSPWDRAALPRPLRDMIHTSAAMVPPFAHEDSALADPLHWAESKEFAGKLFKLSIYSSDYDLSVTHESLSTVQRGQRLSLGYILPWKRQQLAFGPSYNWDRYGRLWRRTWYEPDTVMFLSTTYSAYPSGELLEYGSGKRRQDIWDGDSSTIFSEHFDRKGRLLGFRFEVHRGGVQEGQFWWDGKPVSETQWRKLRGALLKTALGRDGA